MTTVGVKPIQTRYGGHYFRSRLEARYAVLFDHLGIHWEYEPEGYSTPAGPYLPDFLLHLREPTFFEVKPEIDYGNTDERWWQVCHSTGRPMIVAWGMPRPDRLEPPRSPMRDGSYHLVVSNGMPDEPFQFKRDAGGDIHYAFCSCCICGAVGIEYDGRGARVCRSCACTHGNRDKCYSYDDPKIVRAYVAALSARFERGERG